MQLNDDIAALRRFADRISSDVSVHSTMYQAGTLILSLLDALETTTHEADRLRATLKEKTDSRDILAQKYGALCRRLEDLTPGGSEFHDSPDNCIGWVKDRMEHVGKLAKERNELRAVADQHKRQHDALFAIVEVGAANIKAVEDERDALRKELAAAKAEAAMEIAAARAAGAREIVEQFEAYCALRKLQADNDVRKAKPVKPVKPESSPEEDAAAAARIARMDELSRQYDHREFDAWPVYVQVEYEKLVEAQNAYEAQYC